MNYEAVCRTAPATPGLLIIQIQVLINHASCTISFELVWFLREYPNFLIQKFVKNVSVSGRNFSWCTFSHVETVLWKTIACSSVLDLWKKRKNTIAVKTEYLILKNIYLGTTTVWHISYGIYRLAVQGKLIF